MTTEDEAARGQLSAEMIQKIAEFAQKLVWRKPDLHILREEFEGQYPAVAEALQQHLILSDFRQKLVLPDLRAFGNGAVGVFTDYGGESKARYRTYSTLICGWNLTHRFHELMKATRKKHDLGTKEIAFKDFRMGQMGRAIPDYLRALDAVPGFLFTLAVDNQLSTIFGPQGKETKELISKALAEAGLGERKPEINEKLLRIAHVAAFLTGLLAHDGQKIFWMTDHDAISPTPEMHKKTLELFGRILNIYARKGYSFPLVGGALPFEDRNEELSLQLLDLLSATDIVAGSVDQYLTQKDSVAENEIKVKQGCDRVLQWLARDGIGLKKMNLIMRPGENGSITTGALEFRLKDLPKDATIIPVKV